VPTSFWDFSVKRLLAVKNVFMLAEASEPELYSAFDMTYDWKLKDIFNKIAKGEGDARLIYKHFAIDEPEHYPKDAYRMLFTSNHDENSWTGSAIERLGEYSIPFAAICETGNGMPLIYSGQEAGLNRRLSFFDKDSIEWKNSNFEEVYVRLNNLKLHNRALQNGNGGKMEFLTAGSSKEVLAYKRVNKNDEVITIINLSNGEKEFNIEEKNNYKDIMTGKLVSSNKVKVKSKGFVVLVKVK
jgi:glycosidase